MVKRKSKKVVKAKKKVAERKVAKVVKKVHLREHWMLGFLGFLMFQGLKFFETGNNWDLLWFVWVVWFAWFIPTSH